MTARLNLLSIAEWAASLVPKRGRPLDLGLFSQSLDRVSGPDGFWRDDLEIPLRVLIESYEAEASLSALGRLVVQWDITRYLSNLRRLREEGAKAPEIGDEPIEAPIVITGVPRSGSTFLHGLLAEDPANLVLRCWQTIYPYPLVGRRGRSDRGGIDRRPLRVDRQLKSFAFLTPGIRDLYPLDGWAAQECTEVTAHVFQSRRFDGTHHVPSYRKWLNGHGHLSAYRFHKRFLQHLQYQIPGRQTPRRQWVLKSPDHVFALEALLLVYPDARIVMMHRDPLKVLPSVAQLTEILRVPFAKKIDLLQIGRQVTGDWATGTAIMVDKIRRGQIPPERVFHLHYREVASRPMETIKRLYRHFDIALSMEAADRMSALIAAKPNGGYGRNAYSFERHGIDPEDVRHRFADYMQYFDIRQETVSRPDSARRSVRHPVFGFRL